MKLKDGAVVVGAGVIADDEQIVVVTSDSGVKATPAVEIPAKGRGTQGVRITRLAKKETLTMGWFGLIAAQPLLVQMAADDDPKKLDPNPVPFEVDITSRDLVPGRSERQIMVLAPSRW
jgi:DNA gyrase/topoisomerase IV subunit A